MKHLLILLAAPLALMACGEPILSAGSAPPPAAAPDRSDAVLAAASTAATVADALDVAPPGDLVAIPAEPIRSAFRTFDAGLYVVDGFVASGAVMKGSPQALRIKSAILLLRTALRAASAAQRASAARSYRAALTDAAAAAEQLRSALLR